MTHMARNDRAALNAPRAKPIRCGHNLPLIPANAPPFSPTRSILFNALPRSASSYCFVTLCGWPGSRELDCVGVLPIDMVALTDSKDRPQNRRHRRSTLRTPSGLEYTGSGGRTRCPSWSTGPERRTCCSTLNVLLLIVEAPGLAGHRRGHSTEGTKPPDQARCYRYSRPAAPPSFDRREQENQYRCTDSAT
jgi:hypothetical protein